MNNGQISYNKILCIQLRQLGDVILTTPAIRQLRKRFPSSQIHFLTESLGSAVYINNPYVDKVLVYPKKFNLKQHLCFIYNLYKQKYDLVIDFFGNPKAAQFAWITRAKERLGFYYGIRSIVYTEYLPVLPGMVYSAQQKLCLLQKFINFQDLSDTTPDFFTNISDKEFARAFANKYFTSKDKWVAFCPISRRSKKLWNKNQYHLLAKHLLDIGYKLFIVYGPGEKSLAVETLGDLSALVLIDYEMPTIAELSAILKYCSFFVGNDGGPKHLAVCAGIPTLGIFINIDPFGWTLPNSRFHLGILNPASYQDCVIELQKVNYFQ